MTDVASRISVHLEQVDGFQFLVKFDKEQFEPLRLDEPPPLGHDTAPNAARILAAAIGNCLSASLVFCLSKAKVAAAGVSADVDVEICSQRDAPSSDRQGRRERCTRSCRPIIPRLPVASPPSRTSAS